MDDFHSKILRCQTFIMFPFFGCITLLVLANVIDNIDGFHSNLHINRKISLTSLNTEKSNDKASSIIDEEIILSKNIKSSLYATSLNENEDDVDDSLDLFSATNLVAGTTVGAGIIALPTYCRPDGFIPSSIGLIAVWVFMVSTGLLIAECSTNLKLSNTFNNNNDCSNEDENLGLLGISQITLGDSQAPITGSLYLFLHWALICAYFAEGGRQLSLLSSQTLIEIPNSIAVAGYATIAGLLARFGSSNVQKQRIISLVLFFLTPFQRLLYLVVRIFY